MIQENTGFAAFALYNSLKLHFSSGSYDFFKYNGKTNVSKDAFGNRKDKYSFYKLSRKYSLDDLRNFYVANFINKDVSWVGEIATAEGEDIYKEWQKRNQSLTYRFEQDILHALEGVDSPAEMLSVSGGEYPKLLVMAQQKEITIETLAIMDDIMNFFPMWSKKISDPVIWPSYRDRVNHYKPFINYDKAKFKKILIEKINEHTD